MGRSERLFEEACRFIPGGVNSPVRAFGAVGGTPRFIARGAGPRVFDEDGKSYVDFVCSWGPLVLGHADADVVEAISAAAALGTSFGAPTAAEVEIARLITECVPSIEKVRLVNSGTEATMSAARLARGFTGRDGILKFAGCYHGHADSFLVKAGSGAATFGIPGSAGVTAAAVRDTFIAEYNDLDSVNAVVRANPGRIAAIVVEPVAGNMGLVLPRKGFLEGLRGIADEAGALLVFDEVITGFRVGKGGAQDLFGVRPDLTALGKIIGGGLPVGAYGGREEIMDRLSPGGPVYQAGTLSGNPVAVAAGLATLKKLLRPGAYERLESLGRRMADGLRANVEATGAKACVNSLGSMNTLFFTQGPVSDFATAMKSDAGLYAKYFHGMLERGFALAPSQFETGFVSLAHDEGVIDAALAASREVMEEICGQGR